MRLAPLLLAPFLLLTACDSADPEGNNQPPPGTDPTVATSEVAGLDDRAFNLDLTSDGYLLKFGPSLDLSMYYGNLWMSGMQNGSLRVAARKDQVDNTNGPCAGMTSQVYKVDGDTTYSAEGWPSDIGAPIRADGSPLAYGDEMVWTSYCQDSQGDILNQPFSDLRVNTAMFGHDDYQNVVFVRYEIRNEGSVGIQDARVGFWTDPDLNTGSFAGNLTGIDVDDRLAFVYNDPSMPVQGLVAGSVFLETPADAPLLAHRIVTKNNLPSAYGEHAMDSVQDFDWALKGLDNDGNPMLDPNTNEASSFAFTGDPVAGTGWLDGYSGCDQCSGVGERGADARQLISAGPFTLGAGETRVLTLAYMVESGSNMGDALSRLRNLSSSLRGNPSLWRFAVQN